MPFGRKCITGATTGGSDMWGYFCLQCLSAVSALLGRRWEAAGKPGKFLSPMPFGRKCITGPEGLT